MLLARSQLASELWRYPPTHFGGPDVDADRDHARYVMDHYPHLLTDVERRAHRHLITTYKANGGRDDAAAQAEVWAEGGPRRRWLSDDPEVLALAASGLAAFEARAAGRVLRERATEVSLNYCRRCAGLTRTPRARLCLHCGHAWHEQPATSAGGV
jgi:hypothetical protein